MAKKNEEQKTYSIDAKKKQEFAGVFILEYNF